MPEPIETFVTSMVRAKPSAHFVALALGFIGITYHEFAKQPQFVAWITVHWAVGTLISSIKIAAPMIALYYPSLKRAA
ncbi:MAG: hypothetical protein ACYCOU_00240 [Sulfobacillus sp.]